MTRILSPVAGAAILALAGLGLSGCATTDYVDMKVGEVQAQVTSLADSTNAKLAAHDAAIAKLNGDIQATAARTEELAKSGKFVYNKVADATITFKLGSWQLSDEAKAQIDDIAGKLKSANANAYLEIEGFADATGAETRNRRLGLQRSYAVLDAFRDHGIALNRMNIFSYGEDNPAVASKGAAAENRRVVITVVQ
jgi:outer membrane protein OmpA-like peptidoglycan-associated protein